MEFKLIVAGSRGFENYKLLSDKLMHFAHNTLHDVSIVSGMARGADRLACEFAKQNQVLCHEFPADWNTYGKRAGFMRNEQMARFADGLMAFWDGESAGTAHMIQTMLKMGKHVQVVNYTELKPQIFVFGSNLAGRHGAGAAREAVRNHGAVMGVGIGHVGKSYAIPTKDRDIKTLPLNHIELYVKDFLDYAEINPGLEFNVTRIGCGLAGYQDADIAPFFKNAPKNCNLPLGW